MRAAIGPDSYPLPEREADRLRALHDLDILDTPVIPALDNLCELARDLFDVPVALVSLVGADRQLFKGRCGIDLEGTDRGAAFCAHTILGADLLVVADATKDARFAETALVVGEPHVRFYAGAPLSTVPGLQIGAFCLVDFVPREFGERQRRQLARIAAVAVEQLKVVALQRRDSRFEDQRALVESVMRTGSFERDLDSGRLFWSDGLYQLFDFDPRMVPNLDAAMARVHPADLPVLRRVVERSLTLHEPYHMQFRIIRPDGEERWLDASSHLVHDAERRVKRLVGTITDITDRRIAEAELASREERYRALTEAGSTIIWRFYSDGGLAEAWGWAEFTGQSIERARGGGWLAMVHPADVAYVLGCVSAALARQHRYEAEHRLRRADGTYRWVLARGIPLKNDDGTIREWVGTTTDIHERKESAETLQRNKERLKLALDAGGMVAWEFEQATGALIQSGRVVEVYGFEATNYVAYTDRIHGDDVAAVRKTLAQAAPGAMASVECRFLRPDGRTVWLEIRCVRLAGGERDRIVGVTFDITQRKEAEERIWYSANHDSLTGLPNRALFNARIDALLGAAAGSGAALILIDVDDFKGINDTLGHDAGDRMLQEMAKRLRSMLRERDLVARFGGDEFAVVVPGMADRAEVLALCRRMLGELRRPFHYCERTIASRASLGVALYPDHDVTPAELLKDADMALYSAKAEGRNRAVFYSPEMRRVIERRVGVAAEIRLALARDEIVPYYQPKVGLASGRIDGFEALARWRHPLRGLLRPSAFASAFEDRELSSAIGERMLRKVVADLGEWRRRGVPAMRVAVNLSAAELSDVDLAGRLLNTLLEACISPTMLEVEITESVVFGPGAEQVGATLRRLREAGVTTALDDFGTGHASLTHLKQFPIDTIKIDRSFIRDVLDDADDAAIVAAVVGLGRNLGMKLVAEGVETPAQVEFLVGHGCDFGQGYFFARPMPSEDVPTFMARQVDSASVLAFPPRSVA